MSLHRVSFVGDTSGYCQSSAVVPSQLCFLIPQNTIIGDAVGGGGVCKRPEEIITT